MDVPRLGSLRPDLPSPIETIVMACLEREPKARPRSAAEIAHAFSATATSMGINGPSEIATEMEGLLEQDDLDTTTTKRTILPIDVARNITAALQEPPVSSSSIVTDESPTAISTKVETSYRPRRYLRWLGIGLGGVVATAILLVAGFLLGGTARHEEESRSTPTGTNPSLAPAALVGPMKTTNLDEVDVVEDAGPAIPEDSGESPDVREHLPLDEMDGGVEKGRPTKQAARWRRRVRTNTKGTTSPQVHDKRLVRELSPEQ
jgi:hypothetical protein